MPGGKARVLQHASETGDVASSKSRDPASTIHVTLTWSDVISHARISRQHDLDLETPGADTNKQRVQNTVTAAKAFLRLMGIDVVERIDTSLFTKLNFEDALVEFTRKALKQGVAKSTIEKYRSEMRWIRKAALYLIRNTSVRQTQNFHERLKQLINEHGLTVSAVSKAVLGNKSSLRLVFVNQYYPQPSTVAKFEEYFQIQPGELERLLPPRIERLRSKDIAIVRQEFKPSVWQRIRKHLPEGFSTYTPETQIKIAQDIHARILTQGSETQERISKLCEQPYKYRLAVGGRGNTRPEMPTRLRQQCVDLYAFQTSELIRGTLERKQQLKLPSARKVQDELAGMFGALWECALPDEAMTLGIFAVKPTLIDIYVDFMVQRRGRLTEMPVTVLIAIHTLFAKRYGYVRQVGPSTIQDLTEHPPFFTDADIQYARSNWHEACDAACAYIARQITQIRQKLAQIGTKGRDPFAPVLPILDADLPLNEYAKIIAEGRRRIVAHDVDFGEFTSQARDILLLHLVGLTGFRVKNWSDLYICLPGTTRRSETFLRSQEAGEMYFENDRWQIWMPVNAFKNAESEVFRHADHHHETLPNSRSLIEDIERYLAVRSDIIGGRPDPGRLFVPTARKENSASEFVPYTLAMSFRRAIERWAIYNPYTGVGALKGVTPFGPHAVRDIIATHILKTTNGDVRAAAQALLDTEQMIRKTYGRYLPKDAVKNARRMQASAFE